MAKRQKLGIEEGVLKSLSGSEWGFTIEEVAERNDINRVTASKYLAVLEAKGLVVLRVVGRAKLYSVKR